MLAFKIAHSLAKRGAYIGIQRFLFKHKPSTNLPLRRHNNTKPIVAVNLIHRYYHDDFHDTEDEPNYECAFKEPPVPVKAVLYPNSGDPLIEQLNSFASLQDVFTFIKKYERILDSTHLAQTVLVLWDLQKMFYHVNVISNVTKLNSLMMDYVEQLLGRSEFVDLLEMIADRMQGFDLEALSCVLLYLHKIGVPLRQEVMQRIVAEMRDRLEGAEVLPLRPVARFIVSIFGNSSNSAYFMCQNLMPRIFSYIDECKTAEDVRLTTICLNHLNKIVTLDILNRYKEKVKDLINNGVIDKDELNTILKIILFLNYPHWRAKNVSLLAECMTLLKDNIHMMNVYELLILYKIFYRTHEPAAILNNMQRCACKFLHQLEEEMSPFLDIRLKLLSCITWFSPPAQRPQFENITRKYLDYTMSGDNLMELYNIFYFMKSSDVALSRSYWDKLLDVMESDIAFRDRNLFRIAYNYVNFTRKVNYRHFKFEKRMNQWLEGEIEQGISTVVPSRFSSLAAFFIAYCKDVSLINHAAIKLASDWEQLKIVDCLNLSKSLRVGQDTKNPALKPRYYTSISNTLNRCLERDAGRDVSVNEVSLLLKGCLYRQHYDEELLAKLLGKYNESTLMSSKLIKNVCFCLYSLNALVPSVIDDMVKYVCTNKDNLMAFNVENVAYLCYNLGYTPKNHVRFFEIVKDVLLRDQERLSGLSYIQSSLSLCYFNAMTNTFINQIFNPNFLEKLDAELINCYSKDAYPTRVRYRLMELNRSICIDYPESSVPWFHQKYMDDVNNKEMMDVKSSMSDNIQEYLIKMFDNIRIRKNVITHYGYQIDYVINICHDVAEESKLAMLVLGPKAFTRVNVQLRGYYQQKIRHLEMFGYRVAILKFSDWKDLVCGEDRVTYLNRIVSQKLSNIQICRYLSSILQQYQQEAKSRESPCVL